MARIFIMPPFHTTIISWLFPPLCVHCRREGDWLCPTARQKLLAAALYRKRITLPNVNQVFIRGSYDNSVLQLLIHKLKYSYWSAAGSILPAVLAPLGPVLKQLPAGTVIVSVPLHPRRIKERGFNQAELIAKALGQMTGWPVRHFLKRQRYTRPQTQLNEKQRVVNLTDAFAVVNKTSGPPSAAILIDDVLTTGTTISECARVLRTINVKKVFACTLAKG